MTILDEPRLAHINRPSSKALSSARLLDVGDILEAFFAIHLPLSLLIMIPMPSVPGFPLAAPSKLSLK